MKSKIYLTIALIILSVFCGFAYIGLITSNKATTNNQNMQAGKLAYNLYSKILKEEQFLELNDNNPDTGHIHIMPDFIRNKSDILVILSGVRSEKTLNSLTDYIKTWADQKKLKNKIYLLLYAKAVKQADGSLMFPDKSYFISEKQIH